MSDKELSLSDRRELLIDTFYLTSMVGWLRCGEPMFRHWDKIPPKMRAGLSELKSDDVKNDNWHLRRMKD